jgi:hypothetical protein
VTTEQLPNIPPYDPGNPMSGTVLPHLLTCAIQQGGQILTVCLRVGTGTLTCHLRKGEVESWLKVLGDQLPSMNEVGLILPTKGIVIPNMNGAGPVRDR